MEKDAEKTRSAEGEEVEVVNVFDLLENQDDWLVDCKNDCTGKNIAIAPIQSQSFQSVVTKVGEEPPAKFRKELNGTFNFSNCNVTIKYVQK